MPKRRLVPVTLLLAGFTISACTAILVPDRDDDGVQRCNTGEDCDPTGDERFVAVCVFGEGQPENSDKVCVATFKDDVGCNGTNYMNSRFAEVQADATSNTGKAVYVACSMENLGKRGCRSNAGACEEGLAENAAGVCDDPDALLPAVNLSEFDLDDVAGQDVRDQFCRAMFCDENFVCDTDNNTCKPCEDGEDFGKGGCGQIYIEGNLSSVYTSIDDGAGYCGDAGPDDVAGDEALFGDANEPATP